MLHKIRRKPACTPPNSPFYRYLSEIGSIASYSMCLWKHENICQMYFRWLLVEEPCCLVSLPRHAGWALGPAPPSCRAGAGRGSTGCADVPAAGRSCPCKWRPRCWWFILVAEVPLRGVRIFFKQVWQGPLWNPASIELTWPWQF